MRLKICGLEAKVMGYEGTNKTQLNQSFKRMLCEWDQAGEGEDAE
jgi:hypothetical protein